MLKVLAVIIFIFLVLFIFLALSLCVRVKYNKSSGFELIFSYAFINIRLYPKKKIKKTVKHTNQSAGQQKPKPEEKGSFKETAEMVFDLIKSAFDPLGYLINKIRIDALDFTVITGGADAAEIAEKYGKISAAVYGGVVYLKNFKRVSVKNLFVGYDFNSEETVYKLDVKVKIRLYSALSAAFRFLVKYIYNILSRNTAAKQVKEN